MGEEGFETYMSLLETSGSASWATRLLVLIVYIWTIKFIKIMKNTNSHVSSKKTGDS